ELRASSEVVAVGATRNLAAKTRSELPASPEEPELGAGTSGGIDAQEADFAKQWNLRVIRADAAHRFTDGSRDVTVGVLDSGIDATHPDLAANLDASQSVGCTRNGVPDPRIATC